MNHKDCTYSFVFHSTAHNKEFISNFTNKEKIENIEIIFDYKIKILVTWQLYIQYEISFDRIF